MNRRGFLGAMLALGAAPAIVRASSLMRLAPSMELTDSGLIVPRSGLIAGNQLLTIEDITNEALRVFSDAATRFKIASVSHPGAFKVGDYITIGT